MYDAWHAWQRPELEPEDDAFTGILRQAGFAGFTAWHGSVNVPVAGLSETELIDVLVDIVTAQGPVICGHLYRVFQGAGGRVSLQSLNRSVLPSCP